MHSKLFRATRPHDTASKRCIVFLQRSGNTRNCCATPLLRACCTASSLLPASTNAHSVVCCCTVAARATDRCNTRTILLFNLSNSRSNAFRACFFHAAFKSVLWLFFKRKLFPRTMGLLRIRKCFFSAQLKATSREHATRRAQLSCIMAPNHLRPPLLAPRSRFS